MALDYVVCHLPAILRENRKKNNSYCRVMNHRFVDLDLIGKGCYANVYKAKCKSTGTLFAIKVFTAADDEEGDGDPIDDTCLRECNFYQTFPVHPALVRAECIYMAACSQDSILHVCLAMDYAPTSLSSFLACDALRNDRAADFRARFAVHVACQISSLLSDMHARGVSHRDVTPQNILLLLPGKDDGKLPDVRMCDFGLIHHTHIQHDNLNFKSAQNEFYAPELLLSTNATTVANESGSDFRAADVWSLGLVVLNIVGGLDVADQELLPAYHERLHARLAHDNRRLALPTAVTRIQRNEVDDPETRAQMQAFRQTILDLVYDMMQKDCNVRPRSQNVYIMFSLLQEYRLLTISMLEDIVAYIATEEDTNREAKNPGVVFAVPVELLERFAAITRSAYLMDTRKVVHAMAADMYVRCMQSPAIDNKEETDIILAHACMYMASKFCDSDAHLTPEQVDFKSAGVCTRKRLMDMQVKILHILDFKLLPF